LTEFPAKAASIAVRMIWRNCSRPQPNTWGSFSYSSVSVAGASIRVSVFAFRGTTARSMLSTGWRGMSSAAAEAPGTVAAG